MGRSPSTMGQPRLLLAVEAVVLLASLACATAESGHVTDITDQSEVVLLQEHENSPDVMDAAKVKVANLAVKEKEEELAAARKTILESSNKKVKSETALTKLQAKAASAVATLAQMKDPVVNATMPADPAVVGQEADKVAIVQMNLAATQKDVDDSTRVLKAAEETVVNTEAAAAKAKVEAIRQVKASNAAKIMKDAKAKGDALAAAKKQRDDGINAEKERLEVLLRDAEKGVIRAKEQQSATLIRDQSKVNELSINGETLKVRIQGAKKSVKEGLIEDRASKYQLVLKKHTLQMAQQLQMEAAAAKSALAQKTSDAEMRPWSGSVLMGQTKEAIEVNKERIKEARLSSQQAYRAFKNAEHNKKMDQDQIKTAEETISEMNEETMKLEKKKELVRSFGATLRSKAERDANVAKSGLAKADGDYQDAKANYEMVTKKVAHEQSRVDTNEKARMKTVQAILTALGEDNGSAAIQAGEAHEGIDAIIKGIKKKKSTFDLKAQVFLAAMSSAKKEEKSALSLQVAANAQFNQAKNNDDTLSAQQTQLNALYAEQAQRKATTQAMLDKAVASVKHYQQLHKSAEKVYESRVAAENYLKDVKVPVAQKMIDDGGEESFAKAEDDGAAKDGLAKIETATHAVDSAKRKAKESSTGILQAQQELTSLTAKAAANEKSLMTAKLQLEASTSDGKIRVEKAKMHLHDVRHPIATDTADSATIDAELKSKLNAAAAARATVDESAKELVKKAESAKSSGDDKEKEDLSATKKNHEAEVEKMNKANDAVEKAKEMYHKAFGATIQVPGHDEHQAAHAKTQSKSSAAVAAATP